MASSVDDEFSLIDDHDTNPGHHHHHYHPSCAQVHAPPSDNHNADDDSDSAFPVANFGTNNNDNRNAASSDARIEKRRDQEEINDGVFKRSKQSASTEYRKDREEWSDTAIGCLLEAYMEKLTQLNRGNLRGRDWEEVAVAVSERCEKQSKSVEQCKNKVDNLKKRYKLERHRMSDAASRRAIGLALACTGPLNIDPKVAMLIAREVAIACRLGVEVAIVVGGRNFFCGDTWVTATGLDRSTAYQIGMMASVMNSILLQSSLEKIGVQTCVQTSFSVQEVAEPYSRQRAIRHLEKGRVVIFGGIGAGTGNPLFSTDTAAALRASEIQAEAVVKGTNVDGVYDCHSQDNNATFEHISFRDLVSRGATAMDMMALTFCEENGIPVVVFNLLQPGNISKAICGDQVGTLIDQTGRIS
ncbi:Uridylate kinase [Hibiscus syriacus]|uniref:UMP kinase n=1 Tax=Hibiscus syriacus TaxID=106335 RepID=A0A6A2WSL1_HIBSY|nr:Uridylate kinase [Hibiscus syriacus]